jgi:hypothetical protein
MSSLCCFHGWIVLCAMWLWCSHMSHAISHSLLIIAIIHLLPVFRLPINSKYFCWASVHFFDKRPSYKFYYPFLSCSATAALVPNPSQSLKYGNIVAWSVVWSFECCRHSRILVVRAVLILGAVNLSHNVTFVRPCSFTSYYVYWDFDLSAS